MTSAFIAICAITAFSCLSASAWSSELASCPIELQAGRVISITGDPGTVRLKHGTKLLSVSPDTCLLYGDQLEAGLSAVVTIDTISGRIEIGRNSNPTWRAPEARGGESPRAMAMLAKLFHGVMDPADMNITSASGRELGHSAEASLVPLRCLPRIEQIIGMDLPMLTVAWTPSSGPLVVHARLLTSNGRTIVQASTHGQSYVDLPLEPRTLYPAAHLTLEITDDSGDTLRYPLLVVEPAELPTAPPDLPLAWEVAAWRLTKGGALSSHMDSVARIAVAAKNTDGAKRILQAVLSDQKL